MGVQSAYLFFNLILWMSRAFNDLPEINEFFILNLTIVIVVNSVEKLLRRYFTKEKLRPMFHSFILINSFWTIFVEYLEHFIHNSHQLWWQIL